MPTLADIDLDKGLFTMLKGEPGTRKSTAALSYPKPQYWVSNDQKMEALVLPAKNWGVDLKKDVMFDDYTDWDTAKNKLKQLQLNCPFKTVVVDSITSGGDNINKQVTKFKGDSAYKIGGIAVDTIEDYKAEAAAFREMISILKDIHKFHKIHVVLIAHVVGQRQSNEANKLTHHSRVIVTGGDKISAKIVSYCTEVYHFNIASDMDTDKEGTYQVITSHTGNDFARTSIGLQRIIEMNDKPLYDKWIQPAITKLKNQQPIVTNFNPK